MDSEVQQIKDKLSIVDIVGGYVQLQRAGGNFRARCPFHKEKTPSFMVSPERGTYMCFGCGERGDIFSFVEKMEGIDFPETLRQLAERAGVKLERRSYSPEHSAQTKAKEERLHEVCEAATLFYIEELKKHPNVLEYIAKRGVSDTTRESWRIGYAPAAWRAVTEHLEARGFTKQEIVDAGLGVRSEKGDDRVYDRFRGRIMFPLNDVAGRVIAFSGRFFEKVEGSREEGEPAKYVNSPETELFKKSKILFGLDKAKGFIRKADCILLVEGQFDVVMSHQSGLPFAVAVSGTALTHEHLTLLSRFSKRLVLALDNDAAGIRAGLKSTAMAYAAGFDVKIPNFGPQQTSVAEPATSERSAQASVKDPADLAKENPEALRAAVRASQTAVEYFLGVLRAQARDERGYKQLVEAQVLPLIANLGSKIDQEHFIAIVASKLGVSQDAVRAELARKPVSPGEVLSEEGSGTTLEKKDMPTLESAALMLIFYFEKDAALQEKLKGLLKPERYAALLEPNTPDAERYRFEFEQLGGNTEEVKNDLLATIERTLLAEELAGLYRELTHASVDKQATILKKLADLKKKTMGLRN